MNVRTLPSHVQGMTPTSLHSGACQQTSLFDVSREVCNHKSFEQIIGAFWNMCGSSDSSFAADNLVRHDGSEALKSTS